jgi:hypothetical protein
VHFSLYFKIWDFLSVDRSAHRHNLLIFRPGAIVNLSFCREIVLDLSDQENLVEMLRARASFFRQFCPEPRVWLLYANLHPVRTTSDPLAGGRTPQRRRVRRQSTLGCG